MKYRLTRHGTLVSPDGEVLKLDPNAPLARPYLTPTFKAFTSPASGKRIEDHAGWREDLKATGCIEAGDRKPVEVRDEEKRRRYLSPARD